MLIQEFNKIVRDGKATLMIDTNVLLNLYRLPNKVVESFILGYKELSNPKKISWVVKKEYDRNKSHIKEDSFRNAKQAFNQTLGSVSGVRDKLKKYQIDLKKADLIFDSADFDEIESKLMQIEDSLSVETKKFSEDTQINRPHIQQASDFISEIFSSHIEIPEPSYDVLIKQMVEGYVRAKHHFPPGYEDFQDKYHQIKKKAADKKQDRWSLKPENLTDYLGDYQLWCSVLEEGRSNDVLFVTGDLKSDWWLIPKSKKLEEYVPRSELLKEFSAVNPDKTIKFLPLNLFIYYVIAIYGKEPFESYFLSRGDEKISDELDGRLDTELAKLFARQLSQDDRASNGLPVEINDDSVVINSSLIEGFEIIEVDEIKEPTKYSKEMLFYLQLEVSAEGTFEFPLIIDDEIWSVSSGDFTIQSGVLEAKVTVGFDVDGAIIEDIPGENINIADLEILKLDLTYFDTDVYDVHVDDGFDPDDEYDQYRDSIFD